jgi:hypothetical protein
MRMFRITNIRIPAIGGNVVGTVSAIISTSPNQVLPVGGAAVDIGVVGPVLMTSAMGASVNGAPPGGGNPFAACVPVTSPTLAAQLTFTEGFATAFKTRVVPLTNTAWASTAPNTGTPGQNLPGGIYGGFASNNESGFILPAAALTNGNNVTYTVGLADYGTRLKAVFNGLQPGVTLYVSTTSTSSSDVPGGTSATPYAVLVAASQSDEGNNDGAAITPLTSAVIGSDGLAAYPLTADGSGNLAAIWEVVNANPFGIDSLTFSVYLAHSTLNYLNGPYVASLTFSPEPGGGTFSTANASFGLASPVPRFGVYQPQGGTWAQFNLCPLSTNALTVPFSYTTGGAVPASQTVTISATPANPAVALAPTTSSGGNWLSASLSGSSLTVSANPTGLSAAATPYAGTVKLSAPGYTEADVAVTLTVSSPPSLSISKSHLGNFIAGQLAAAYTITVSNGANAGPTNGLVTVTENPPSGMSVVSMAGAGNVWACTTSTCTTNSSINGGGSYPAIAVNLSVSPDASSPLSNVASVSGGGSSTSPSFADITNIVPPTCTVTGDRTTSVADVQMLVNQALGSVPSTYHFTSSDMVSVADVQIVINAAMSYGCR